MIPAILGLVKHHKLIPGQLDPSWLGIADGCNKKKTEIAIAFVWGCGVAQICRILEKSRNVRSSRTYINVHSHEAAKGHTRLHSAELLKLDPEIQNDEPIWESILRRWKDTVYG